MLPPVKDVIELDLKGHLFKFKRLTWKDTINQPRNRTELLAFTLQEVSGLPVDYQAGLKLIGQLPIPIQERIHTIFIGSQDPRRLFTINLPYAAPDALDYKEAMEKVEREEENLADEASTAFAQRYGQEALDQEKALTDKILDNSGYKGARLITKAELGAMQDQP